MKKPKVIMVTGPPLAGKTTYIKGKYANDPGIYHFDLVSEYKAIPGEPDDFQNADKAIEVYNSLMDKLVDAVLFERKDMVFEFCTGYPEMDEPLAALIHIIKASGTEVALVELAVEMDTVMQRREAVVHEPEYVSSYYTNEVAFDILSNFFEDLAANRKHVT